MTFTQSFIPYEIPHYGLVRLPRVEISADQKQSVGLSATASNYDFLAALARQGFKAKRSQLKPELFQKYGKRAKYELEIFEELGFTDYVLLVWMVIAKARELGVFIDYGRGSCAGSLIFWFLGITGVDSVDKGLLFERFVSRVRSKKQIIDGEIYLQGDLIADADLNLGEGRDAIVEWLRTIYPNRISKILNLSTFTGKILIKDVYKSYEEVSEEEANRVSTMLEKHFGIVEDLRDAQESNTAFHEWTEEHKKTYQIALKLVDLIRQTSIHASGYVVSFYDLHETIPLECSKEGELVSGFDMREVCNFAIKLDLLNLTTNHIIKDVLGQIQLDIADLNLDNNPLIYDHFQNNDLLPYGLYQISADCAYGVLNQIKPKDVFELSDVNACARPGALSYVESYVSKTHECPHPLFEQILKKTRNHCLYQEQMMHLLMAVGFTADESELCRKIVGKKLVEKVKEWKDKIYAKIKERNLPENLGDILWKILDDSSKYSFNLSHSVATSYLSALTVYLKYQHPAEFYCACLNSAKDLAKAGETPQDQVGFITEELPYFGIKLLPPDILKSKVDFTIENGDIRFGLKLLKGIADKNLEGLQTFRKEVGATKFEVFSQIKNSGLNIGVGCALIQAGCLEQFDTYNDKDGKPFKSRSRLTLEYCLWAKSDLLNDKERALCMGIGAKSEINWDVLRAVKYLAEEAKDEKGKPLIKETRFVTIKKRYQPYKEIYEQNSRNERLANFFYERKILGYSYSESLLDIFSEHIDGLKTVKEVMTLSPETRCKIIGFVSDPYSGKTRKGNRQFRFRLSDETGDIRVQAFNEKIDQISEQNGRLPIEEDLCICNCKKMDGDSLFIERGIDGVLVGIQTAKIYMRLSELRDGKDTKDTDSPEISQKST